MKRNTRLINRILSVSSRRLDRRGSKRKSSNKTLSNDPRIPLPISQLSLLFS